MPFVYLGASTVNENHLSFQGKWMNGWCLCVCVCVHIYMKEGGGRRVRESISNLSVCLSKISVSISEICLA